MTKPAHKINIVIETDKKCPKEARLRGAALRTLEAEGVKKGISLNILLTDDRKIKVLNKKFLGRNGPTDVIAFGAKTDGADSKGFLGEIAISADTADHNARRFGTSRDKEIFLYVVHGILHLLGYDDGTELKKRIMQGRQDRISGEIWNRIH